MGIPDRRRPSSVYTSRYAASSRRSEFSSLNTTIVPWITSVISPRPGFDVLVAPEARQEAARLLTIHHKRFSS